MWPLIDPEIIVSNMHTQYKFQLFPLFTTRIAFTWYSNLPPNSVQNWANMERCFHDKFYRPQPEETIADLMNTKQMVDELTIDFIKWFSKAKSCFSIQLPEVESAAMVAGNVLPQLKDKLVAHEYGDLRQLASKAN